MEGELTKREREILADVDRDLRRAARNFQVLLTERNEPASFNDAKYEILERLAWLDQERVGAGLEGM